MADADGAWACPQGHVDWKRPTTSDLAQAGDDVWFHCHACGARWKATAEQRGALVRSHDVTREFAGLAAEVETLSQRVQQAAEESVEADGRRRIRRRQKGEALERSDGGSKEPSDQRPPRKA